MKLVIFAVLVAALALGSFEGIRLYSQVEVNDERFIGMTTLVIPMFFLLAIVALHGAMFRRHGAA